MIGQFDKGNYKGARHTFGSILSAFSSFALRSGPTRLGSGQPDATNANFTNIADSMHLRSEVNYLTGGGYVLPNCP